MRQKTIKSVCSRKIAHWIDHVEDEETKAVIRENAIVSGGAIASMLLGEKVNDFDIYLRTPEAAEKVAAYYVAVFQKNPPPTFNNGESVEMGVCREGERVKIVVKSAGVASEHGDGGYQYFEMLPPEEAGQAAFEYVNNIMARIESPEEDADGKNPKYRPRFMTSNAITLSDDIQIVIRFTGDIERIHENYDFTHCKCAYDHARGEIFIHPDAMECMLNRELRYTTSKYPLCSIIRIRKFLQRDWHINAGQIVKMAWDLNKLDLTDIDTLEDQMVGVDSAYFREVIALLRERTEAGKPIDDAYLMQVIDKVF